MTDGHDSGGLVGDVSSHDPGHSHPHDHGHHHNDDPSFDPSANSIPGSHIPESNSRWPRNEGDYDEDDDAEEQPLLTRRSRRAYSPAPILAVIALVLIVAIMGIVVVVSKSRDGYTGSGGEGSYV